MTTKNGVLNKRQSERKTAMRADSQPMIRHGLPTGPVKAGPLMGRKMSPSSANYN